MNWIAVLSTMSALSVFCLFGGFVFTRRDRKLSDRLDVYLATGDAQQAVTLQELELSNTISERVVIPIAQRAARVFLYPLIVVPGTLRSLDTCHRGNLTSVVKTSGGVVERTGWILKSRTGWSWAL